MTTFAELGVREPIAENLKSMGLEDPAELHIRMIPEIIKKRDLILLSDGDCGETTAFGVPLVQSVLIDVPAVQFLVLAPTRLAVGRIQEELNALVQGTGTRVASLSGSESIEDQVASLKEAAHILVATPVRLLEHLKRRTVTMSVVRGVVLSRADMALAMGLLPEIKLILGHLPRRHQKIMTAQQMPHDVEAFVAEHSENPVFLKHDGEDSGEPGIEHCYCIAPLKEKDQLLLAFMEQESPERSLIFCNTKIEVKSLAKFLGGAGMSVLPLSCELTHGQRARNLEQLKSGRVQHLVCTDDAAQGVDIPNLSHVFIYSASDDADGYLERTRRTQHKQRAGRAISLISAPDLPHFNDSVSGAGVEARELSAPSPEELLQSKMRHRLEVLEKMGFAEGADVREEFEPCCHHLTDAQKQSLLPFLLDKFFSPKYVDESQEYESSEVRASPSRPKENRPYKSPRTRGRRDGGDRPDVRDHRDSRDQREPRPRRYPGLRSYATVCLALGEKDGLNPGDIKDILKKHGKVKLDEIGRIDMRGYESFINVAPRAVNNLLHADGKRYRNYELFISESPFRIDERPS